MAQHSHTRRSELLTSSTPQRHNSLDSVAPSSPILSKRASANHARLKLRKAIIANEWESKNEEDLGRGRHNIAGHSLGEIKRNGEKRERPTKEKNAARQTGTVHRPKILLPSYSISTSSAIQAEMSSKMGEDRRVMREKPPTSQTALQVIKQQRRRKKETRHSSKRKCCSMDTHKDTSQNQDPARTMAWEREKEPRTQRKRETPERRPSQSIRDTIVKREKVGTLRKLLNCTPRVQVNRNEGAYHFLVITADMRALRLLTNVLTQ